MSAVTMKLYKILIDNGTHEKVASALVDALEDIESRAEDKAKEVVESKELATKSDLKIEIEKLRVEIEKSRYDMLKFIIWTGAFVVFTLGGLLAKGFGWW